MHIDWEPPLFSDNSGLEVTVQQSHLPGVIPIGETDVVYTAFDVYGNNNTCIIHLVVQGLLYSLFWIGYHDLLKISFKKTSFE